MQTYYSVLYTISVSIIPIIDDLDRWFITGHEFVTSDEYDWCYKELKKGSGVEGY